MYKGRINPIIAMNTPPALAGGVFTVLTVYIDPHQGKVLYLHYYYQASSIHQVEEPVSDDDRA